MHNFHFTDTTIDMELSWRGQFETVTDDTVIDCSGVHSNNGEFKTSCTLAQI